MSLTIEEDIGWAGGKLVANSSGYRVQFYLPGPDKRYSGDVFWISDQALSAMIDSYLKAFERYEALKRIVPQGAKMEDRVGDLNVRVGAFEGVCMRSYHNPVRTRADIDRVVSVLRRIKDTRGPELVATAKALKQG